MIYFDLIIGFLKVGLFAFGGAYGAIPLIRDVVLSYGWIEDEMLTYMIAVSESTPGPIMVNLATYVGSSQAGFSGAHIATTAVVLPSFIIILLVMVLLKKLLKNPYVQAVLQGVKPCIIGIILATGIYMIIQHSVGSFGAFSINVTAVFMTVVLAAIYFGSRKVLKRGISPIGLIGICPPFDKKTFILDFVNSFEDVQAAFAPFYTVTLLSGNLNPKHIYNLEANLDAFLIFDPIDIERFNEILFKQREKTVTPAEKKALTTYLQRASQKVKAYDIQQQKEIRIRMRGFVRFYEFLLQASCFKDVELHKKYIFITYLLSYLNIASGGSGFDLTGKIKASNFIQRKGETYTKETQVSRPVMKLPQSDGFHLTEQKLERLSQIIADINSRTGKAYDSDVAVKAMLQIRDILLKSDKLKTSARTNSVSFREDTKKLQDCVGLINRDWHKSMRPFWGVFYYLFRLSFPVY